MSRPRVIASAGILFVAVPGLAAQAPSPESLPDTTLDCYRSVGVGVALPEKQFREIAVDGDNFDTPPVRYRLQVVDKATLKLIHWPNRPALRTEHPKAVFEMARDFTNKHRIVAWREDESAKSTIYTINYDDNLFTILQVPAARVQAFVTVEVHKCTPVQ
jgi:hypothetical protein